MDVVSFSLQKGTQITEFILQKIVIFVGIFVFLSLE